MSETTQTESRGVAVVVATLGTSPWLERALVSIDRQRQEQSLKLLVVTQGKIDAEIRRALDRYADQQLARPEPCGFAAANNLGLEQVLHDDSFHWIALVNDDVELEPRWLSACLEQFESSDEPTAAASLSNLGSVQGQNRMASAGPQPDHHIDGLGISWHGLRAQQVGHGERKQREAGHAGTRSVFGVSATAAVYLSSALRAVHKHRGFVFDEKLDTYYEDVELACRLQQLGWSARTTDSARCTHLGSASATSRKQTLLVSNRHLVLARQLGWRYPIALPRLLMGDLRDAGPRALSGWARAVGRLPGFWHLGAPQPLEAR